MWDVAIKVKSASEKENKTMSEEAKNDRARETELSGGQIEQVSGGIDTSSDTLASQTETTQEQVASRPGVGILKSTDGGRTW